MKFGNGDPAFRIHIREYTPEDCDACVSVFKSNQDVLPDAVDQFIEFLEQGTSWFLVAELNDRVVACGGLEISGDTKAASFRYDIVERQHQRLGIGSLLALTRLALVPSDQPTALVTLETQVATETFYQRFGFERM